MPNHRSESLPRRRVSPTADRLARREGFLTRSDLAGLGLERRAVDAVFRALPVVVLPGYARPLIRTADYLDLIDKSTFNDDRVRPRQAVRRVSTPRKLFDSERARS